MWNDSFQIQHVTLQDSFGRHLLPFSASCSMLYPGLGSLERFSTRAKRSRQLPTAMSMVSPKI